MAVSPSRRRSVLQLVADHNPFYLLSAVSMLLACVLLSNTTTYQPIGLSRLVGLIATLGIYELLLVGLGLYLLARRRLMRDGVMLLALEAVFLADIGFIASETYQHSLQAGLVINGVLLAIAVAKIGAIFHVLKMPLRSSAFATVVTTIAVLLLHPAWLKWVSTDQSGRVPVGALYALWWVAAGVLTAYALAFRHAKPLDFSGALPGLSNAGVGHILVLVPLVSLIAHLGTAHWVYKCPFNNMNVSPLLAALPVLLSRLPGFRYFGRPEFMALNLILLAAALLTSADTPRGFVMSIGPAIVTPPMLAFVAVYFSTIDTFAARYFLRLAVAGATVATVYVIGPTWASLTNAVQQAYRWTADSLGRLLPSSQTAWGVLALAGAFVMLAVGAAISLLRQKTPPGDEPTSPSASPAAEI